MALVSLSLPSSCAPACSSSNRLLAPSRPSSRPLPAGNGALALTAAPGRRGDARWRAPASLPSFASFLPSFFKNNKGKEDEEKAARLKEELLAAIAPLDRGAEATPEDKDRVEEIARRLEEARPAKEPLKSDLLNGKWELLYTTSTSILQPQMNRQWMYADRRSPEFMNGVRYFLEVAQANKRNNFICCPCDVCRNQKEHSSHRVIHSHLFQSGFMSGYNCWTKHGERGVMMEDNEEEENDDNYHDMFAEYGTGNGMEDNDEEEAEDRAPDEPIDDLDQAITDAKAECEIEKVRVTFDQMLKDHKTMLYPNCEDGQKKLGSTLELLQWKAENGVTDSGFTEYSTGSKYGDI